VLYKLGDAFAGALMTPFLLKAMAYSSAEVGVVNKVIGLWLTIAGALLGGALMLRLGLWRSLLLFGVLQAASNLGFWWLAAGARAVPGLTMPAFDWGFVSLDAAHPVDGGLLMVIAFENLSGGMGTAAFLAFLMSLCSSASQCHAVRAAQRLCLGGPGVGGAAGRRAGRVDRLAHLLHRVHGAGAAGAGMLWWIARGVRRWKCGAPLKQRRSRRWAQCRGTLQATRPDRTIAHDPHLFATDADVPLPALVAEHRAPPAPARCT
jgi:PAT family beta-lactamase induction signal transducer AmpG